MSKTQTVQAAETGAVRSDGAGRRVFSADPKAPMHDPTAGRHSIGARTGDAGTFRDGQGASGSGIGTGVNQKTGVSRNSPSRSMEFHPSIDANQAETSKNLRERILANSEWMTEGGAADDAGIESVIAERVGQGYEFRTPPDAPLQLIGGGTAPMGNAQIEAAASVNGMPSSKGTNPINGGRASWMRKD